MKQNYSYSWCKETVHLDTGLNSREIRFSCGPQQVPELAENSKNPGALGSSPSFESSQAASAQSQFARFPARRSLLPEGVSNLLLLLSLSFSISWSLLKLMSIELVMPSNHLIIELVMPSNHLIFCHPLLLLPSIFPSIRVFSNESVPCIRWPKYWSFSFSISPSNEHMPSRFVIAFLPRNKL